MNRIILILTFLSVALTALAKDPAGVRALFDGRYNRNPSATVTIMKGGLSAYNLDLYQSIALTDANDKDVADIEKAVLYESRNLDGREMVYSGGRLYYAFLDISAKDKRKYVFYLNKTLKGGNKVILLYIEGSALPDHVKSIFSIPNATKFISETI